MKSIIIFFGLKGSWKWAKRQMRKGKIVRCKHWSGALKYRIQSNENQLLECAYERNPPYKWGISNHHISYEDFTDYETVNP